MVDRLIGAFKGDVATYEQIEHDENATVQAALVVFVAAVLGGLGSGFTNEIIGGDDAPSFVAVFFMGVAAAFISWILWAGIIHLVGSRFFGADSTFGEMLRVIGFAAVVTWLVVIPVVGIIAVFWYLWVVFKAIRAGLDLPTGPTVLVILIGLVIRIILRLILV
ncbi:MAG: YIP1 family protein [Actinomycetota bacterium]